MGRPKIPIVSRELVITSALEIIDDEGLEAMSVRRLAEKIGVNRGTLYHHYRYMDDILRDVLVHVLAPLNPTPEPVADWKDYFMRRSRTYIRLLLEHPNLANVMFRLLPRTYGLAVEEQGVRVLRDAGVPLRYAVIIREQIESIIRGALQFSCTAPLFGEIPDNCPDLFAAVAAAGQTNAEERVEFAVRALLDGVGQRLPEWSPTALTGSGERATAGSAGASAD